MTIAIDINEVIRDYINQFIKYYKKTIDPSFEIEYDDVTNFRLETIFPFVDAEEGYDKNLFYQFKYEDCAYELFSRADVMERNLPAMLNMWMENDLKNFSEENIPNVIIVSTFEAGLSIPSTLNFLSRIGIRAREYFFPIDSSKIYDKCDILITANPDLIEGKPEGKYVFKINAPYNKEAEVPSEYSFDSLADLIHDEKKTLINLIEDED